MRPQEGSVAFLKPPPVPRRPPADARKLTISSDLAEMPRVRDFVAATLAGLGLTEKDIFRVDLSLVEICINIILYAYPREKGEISLTSWREPRRLFYEVRDSGIPFDPRTMRKPKLREILRTARKGGFGIFLSRKMMDGFDYRREDGQNVLTLSKKLPRRLRPQ
jgi:anti-sigma regulatory factor (Ser/Thr protein kinase)